MATTMIETRTGEGLYGLPTTMMIVEHPTHGRLLVSDGYGSDAMGAYMYRWRHGLVAKLQPGDTLESLGSEQWNEGTFLLSAVMTGHDASRPILEWTGECIERLADTLYD